MSDQRNTVQRQIVLNALKRLGTHPSVSELYDEIVKEHPAISKSTIYRNLRYLSRSGTIRQVTLPNGLERYDGNPDRHYHFICKHCGGVYDLDMDYLTKLNDSVQAECGFQIDDHDIIFTGVCQMCC